MARIAKSYVAERQRGAYGLGMSNTPTVSSLTNYQLSDLTSAFPESRLDADQTEAFRDALIARGYGDTDPADVPERVWNKCLDIAEAAQ